MNHYKNSIESFDMLAQSYQDKFMDLDLYNDTYSVFCKLIEKQNATIFEIGCGPGNITKYLLSQRPDFKIEAIDLAPNMIKLAKENNPAAVFKIMDCKDIDLIITKFDSIVCGFCIPYLSKQEVEKLIKDCAYLLNPSGILYFSTIEDDHNKSGYETSSNGQYKSYVYYYPEDYLQQLLKENNFEVLDLKRKYFQKPDGTISSHIIFIGRNK
jgi:2-polyprenyl-3-methyl-5-hydroxy-6-metoxy-1,4-benzoquinol methylase